MYKHACAECSNDFMSAEKIRKFCSCTCSTTFRNRNRRKIHKNICFGCGIGFVSKEVIRRFCSSSCSATFSNKNRVLNPLPKRFCEVCENPITSRRAIKRGTRFCNKKCSGVYNYHNYIDRWKKGIETGLKGVSGISGYIRKYLFEKYDNKCSKCGWSETNKYTKKIPLTIEHRDGDWKNNKEENLELLCPNCHSLTPFYGALNKGRGRPTKVVRV